MVAKEYLDYLNKAKYEQLYKISNKIVFLPMGISLLKSVTQSSDLFIKYEDINYFYILDNNLIIYLFNNVDSSFKEYEIEDLKKKEILKCKELLFENKVKIKENNRNLENEIKYKIYFNSFSEKIKENYFRLVISFLFLFLVLFPWGYAGLDTLIFSWDMIYSKIYSSFRAAIVLFLFACAEIIYLVFFLNYKYEFKTDKIHFKSMNYMLSFNDYLYYREIISFKIEKDKIIISQSGVNNSIWAKSKNEYSQLILKDLSSIQIDKIKEILLLKGVKEQTN